MAINDFVPDDFYGDWKEKLEKKDKARNNEDQRAVQEERIQPDKTNQVNPVEETGNEVVPTQEARAMAETDDEEEMEVETEKSKSTLADVTTEQKKDPVAKRPTPKDFSLPETDMEMETLIKAMEEGGSLRSEAEANIKSRRAAFNKATKEYDKEMRTTVASNKPRTRQASLEKRK